MAKIWNTKTICWIFCLLIRNNFDNGKSENNYIILTLTILLIIYVLIGLVQLGISSIYYYGENILLLVLILITFRKLKTEIGIVNLTRKIKENKLSILWMLMFGFTPYLLAELIPMNTIYPCAVRKQLHMAVCMRNSWINT